MVLVVGMLALGVVVMAGRLWAPVPVSTARVVRGPAVDTVFATGHVEARQRRQLRPIRPGVVEAVFRREHDEVRVGDPVLRLRNTAREARHQKLQAEMDWVTGELRRQRQLVAAGVSGRVVLDDLESRERKARADLDALGAEDKDDAIVSPIDGVVLAVSVEPGEAVGLGTDLAKVGDLRELILECEVDEEDVSRVRPGQEALVRLAGSDADLVTGEVYEVLPDALRSSKSFRVRVRFPDAVFEADPGAGSGLRGRVRVGRGAVLLSGMSAEVGIVVDRRAGALLVPRGALTPLGSVFLVEGGRLAERPVKVGIRNLDRCEILEGVEEGQEVVSDGVANLKAGQRVRPADAGARP